MTKGISFRRGHFILVQTPVCEFMLGASDFFVFYIHLLLSAFLILRVYILKSILLIQTSLGPTKVQMLYSLTVTGDLYYLILQEYCVFTAYLFAEPNK